MDNTALPMRDGLLHRVAVMNRATRRVLGGRVSHSQDGKVCTEVSDLVPSQVPAIVYHDPGSRYPTPRPARAP